MESYVCGVDLGTSRIKAALFDVHGTAVATTAADATPFEGGVLEFDAGDTCTRTGRCLAQLMRSARPGNVEALVVTGQRATVVPVGGDGAAAGPAVSWQDTRGEAAGAEIVQRVGPDRFARITGLAPSALWSLAKIAWLGGAGLDVARPAGGYALLTDHVLGWLGERTPITDPSGASVTGLLDLERGTWSDELLDAAGLTREALPEIGVAGTVVGRLTGEVAAATGLPAGLPLVLGGGDQQCSALGSGVVDPGRAALGLGTAAVVSCPVERPLRDAGAGWFCTAHVVPRRWVVEAIHNAYGATLRWCRDLLGLGSVGDLEELAAGAPAGARDVLLLPFLAGIGSPDFDADVRGAVLGLDRLRGRAEVARAALEGVSFELRRILDALEDQVPVRTLAVSGGGAVEGLTTRLLADATGRTCELHAGEHATLRGAALLAWTGVGRFATPGEGAAAWSEGHVARLEPGADAEVLRGAYHRYHRAVEMLRRHAASRPGGREPR